MKDILFILIGVIVCYVLDIYLPEKVTDILFIALIIAGIWYYVSKIDKLEKKVKALEEKCDTLWNREDNNVEFMMKNFKKLNSLEDKLEKQSKSKKAAQ